MEKIAQKILKLLQREKVDEAIELISKTLADSFHQLQPNDVITAYHLFHQCYVLKDFKEAHKALNTAAQHLAEEGQKKSHYNIEEAIENFSGAVIRYSFGEELEKAEENLKELYYIPKVDRFEIYHLAKDIFETLKSKNMKNLFNIKKKYKKFFAEKANNWALTEMDYYATPIIRVDSEIPEEILAGADFKLELIVKNISLNIARKLESRVIPPENFRFRSPSQRTIKMKKLEPDMQFRHPINFYIDEKAYGNKYIAYETLTYEDTRGNRYGYEITPTKIQIGTQSGILVGTLKQKAPRVKPTVKLGVPDITKEEKKSIDKLIAKRKIFKDLLRKNEENLNEKIITNEQYMKIYIEYREKLEEIDRYLKDLGYEEKEGYTEVTCIYDGSKFYVEEGQCPRCGDLYTVFFDEIVSIFYFMIMHQSGVCIFNKGFGKELNADLTSGLITAVQSFLGELTGQDKTRFTEFSQSGFNILTGNSKYATSAIVMSMRASERLKDRLIQFLELFENKHKDKLTVFSGNLDDFVGSFETLSQFIPIDLLRPHKINYNLLQEIKLSSISRQIIENVPEIKERKIEKVFLDNFVNIIRKKLRRLDYEKLIAGILELKENGILSTEEVSVEEPIPEPVMEPVSEPIMESVNSIIEPISEPEGEISEEEAPRFCVECGAKLPPEKEKILFCINCGARQPD
ncbi:MAG: hypothetical protein HWN67_21110 [Candidatus Helarchaeota archaeon]|nr:hypothetical protein [Candidatus Helarchaeota archaeon]